MFIGKPVPRKEGRAKVVGAARYVDDLTLPGMLFGATVRSPVQRGRIRDVRFEGDVPWDEFTVVTAADVPPPNRIALILDDQPCLADGIVNHAEEPVVLIAHADKSLVERARRSVVIDIEPLPAVHTIDEALDGADRGVGRRQHLQVVPRQARRRRRRARAGRARSSKASTKPARRSSSTSSRRA